MKNKLNNSDQVSVDGVKCKLDDLSVHPGVRPASHISLGGLAKFMRC